MLSSSCCLSIHPVVAMVTMHWGIADQDKLSALHDIVLARFHAACQKARLWFAGQAYRCTESNSVSPSDNVVAIARGSSLSCHWPTDYLIGVDISTCPI